MESDAACLGGGEVVRSGIHRRRHDSRLGGERGKPAGDPLPLSRPIDHVKDHDHRLASRRGGCEEVANRSVVVFLLRQHGHDHVGGVADEFGPVPVLAEGAVDVGRVEHHEPGGLGAARILPPDEHVGGGLIEGVFVAPPGHGPEAGKQRRQVDPLGDAAGEARHRMERAGRLGHRPADHRAHKRVGDQALARVGAAADGGDQERLAGHLRPEFAEQRAVPAAELGIAGA